MRKLLLIAAVLLVVAAPVRAAPCPGVEPWSFSDVDASDPFCAYMTWMAQQGITTGCRVIDDTHRLYCPVDAVTRSQMAAFMGRLADTVGDQLFASVSAAGNLVRGRHAVSSQYIDNAGYVVAFDQDVSTCGFTATVGNPNFGEPAPALITVSRHTDDKNAVWVAATDSSGTKVNRPFYVTVIC